MAARKLWFSCGAASRKARNLAADPRATATTDNAYEPVIVEGTATRVIERGRVAAFTRWVNDKYDTDYGADFFTENWVVRLQPVSVFALVEAEFTSSPTRWTFDQV